MPTDHPTDTELQQFASGELADARFEEVAAHLETCDQCGEFLRKPGAFPKLAAGDKATEFQQPISEGPGSLVGPYKLLQKVGEGGMGVVYMAEQEKPVRRVVALKIIKPGMDSSQVIARFEAERQALAMMDHHHIAKVLDAGTTDTGRPYFAMELVKGVPITEYCDRNKLNPRERLEMFIPVCQAIQHAHQKGIIHRDIKPSNVLVTLYDGKPVPKVIDFGIAKATQQKLTDRTMFTGIGQILGTLEYMSPEQAEMNQLDVDTRSDVYSLGVMLYELLTGSTPIAKDRLRNVGLEEMLRTIRETEPQKASTRLSESGESLPSISAVRKTEPAKLSKLVRGDLDWIVMKALEKDRTRRYETANGLAMDVQRYLSDDAVEASPPSTSYKFRKFARRNKTALATGVTIAGILIVATVVSSSLAVWAINAEKVASTNEAKANVALAAEQQAREEEQRQRERAVANAEKANREAIKSNEVATFLKDMLKGVAPSVALGRDTTLLREILDNTARRLAEDLSKQPEVEAELRTTLGNVYEELGELDAAAQHHRTALDIRKSVFGEVAAETAESMQLLSETLRGNPDENIKLSRRCLEIRQAVLPGDHEDKSRSMTLLGGLLGMTHRCKSNASEKYFATQQEAIDLLRDGLSMQRRVHGNNHEAVAWALNFYAVTLSRIQGHPYSHEVETLYAEAAKIFAATKGSDHLDTLTTVTNQTSSMMTLGRLAESELLLRDVYARATRVLGKNHSRVIGVFLQVLLDNLRDQGKDSEQETYITNSLAAASEEIGPHDERLATLLNTYGDFLAQRGRIDESRSAYRDAAMAVVTHKQPTFQFEKAVSQLRACGTGQYLAGNRDLAKQQFNEIIAKLGQRIRDVTTEFVKVRTDLSDQLPDLHRSLDEDDWYRVDQWVREVVTSKHSDETHHAELMELIAEAKLLHEFSKTISSNDSDGTIENRVGSAFQLLQVAPIHPLDHRLVKMHRPALFAWLNMKTEHHALCQQLLDELAANADPTDIDAAITILTYAESDQSLQQRAIEIAEVELGASVGNPYYGWRQYCAGLAAFRSGNYDRARDHLDNARRNRRFDVQIEIGASLVLAMVHQREGRSNQANECFQRARRLLSPVPPRHRDIAEADEVFLYGRSSHNVLMNWTLFDEASKLFEP